MDKERKVIDAYSSSASTISTDEEDTSSEADDSSDVESTQTDQSESCYSSSEQNDSHNEDSTGCSDDYATSSSSSSEIYIQRNGEHASSDNISSGEQIHEDEVNISNEEYDITDSEATKCDEIKEMSSHNDICDNEEIEVNEDDNIKEYDEKEDEEIAKEEEEVEEQVKEREDGNTKLEEFRDDVYDDRREETININDENKDIAEPTVKISTFINDTSDKSNDVISEKKVEINTTEEIKNETIIEDINDPEINCNVDINYEVEYTENNIQNILDSNDKLNNQCDVSDDNNIISNQDKLYDTNTELSSNSKSFESNINSEEKIEHISKSEIISYSKIEDDEKNNDETGKNDGSFDREMSPSFDRETDTILDEECNIKLSDSIEKEIVNEDDSNKSDDLNNPTDEERTQPEVPPPTPEPTLVTLENHVFSCADLKSDDDDDEDVQRDRHAVANSSNVEYTSDHKACQNNHYSSLKRLLKTAPRLERPQPHRHIISSMQTTTATRSYVPIKMTARDHKRDQRRRECAELMKRQRQLKANLTDLKHSINQADRTLTESLRHSVKYRSCLRDTISSDHDTFDVLREVDDDDIQFHDVKDSVTLCRNKVKREIEMSQYSRVNLTEKVTRNVGSSLGKNGSIDTHYIINRSYY